MEHQLDNWEAWGFSKASFVSVVSGIVFGWIVTDHHLIFKARQDFTRIRDALLCREGHKLPPRHGHLVPDAIPTISLVVSLMLR